MYVLVQDNNTYIIFPAYPHHLMQLIVYTRAWCINGPHWSKRQLKGTSSCLRPSQNLSRMIRPLRILVIDQHSQWSFNIPATAPYLLGSHLYNSPTLLARKKWVMSVSLYFTHFFCPEKGSSRWAAE